MSASESVPQVLEDLTEEEACLWAILSDESGLDQAEFLWYNPDADDGCFRAWAFQWSWWRCTDPLQIDQCSRSVGKSLSIKVRGFSFPILHPGNEMVITAPELVHLEPIVSLIEEQVYATRFSRELLVRGRSGVTHRPFQMNFVNGARLMGRIPQKDGKGVKGVHPLWLELDEAQDYPEAGWVELTETLKRGHEGATWRAHGVTRGLRDKFYEHTQDTPDNEWTVHRFAAMWRPNWTDQERTEKIKQYGSRDDPDYRRNVLGLHGDATNPMFVLTRLMRCHPGSTLVETREGMLRLDEVRVGQEIRNAIGYGRVTAVRRTRRSQLVRVRLHSGAELFSSPEHPYLTSRGWVNSDDLTAGDEFPLANQVLRELWCGDRSIEEQSVLFAHLLGEVAWRELPRLGYCQADIESMRVVRQRVLSAVQGDSVLQRWLRGPMARSSEEVAGDRLSVVWRDLPTSSIQHTFLWDDLSCSVGECSTPKAAAEETFIQSICITRRSSGPELSPMAGVGAGMATRVLDVTSWCRGGCRQFQNRPGALCFEGSGRSRWAQSSIRADEIAGRASRRMVAFDRVESVEVLEQGHRDFDWHSGGQDQVLLYDLTVSGHPSFVLESGVISHNCVDDDPHSDYNEDEFFRAIIKTETLAMMGQTVLEVMDYPTRHLSYRPKATYWSGMDVGYTVDPSEILTFVEFRERGAELSKLKLLSRVSLQRMGPTDQVAAIKRTVEFYGPKVFAMDKTGNGLPLFQLMQELAENDPQMYQVLNVVKGYNFSEKIVVDFDQSIEVDEFTGDAVRDAGIRRTVLEYASDTLRTLVDENRVILPWEADLLKQFQGSTWMSARGAQDQYGRRLYSKGNDHILDASRMAILGWKQFAIEEVLNAQKDESPVLDLFVG